MITIDMPIVVEGKYDKIKLSSIVDTMIITTDGFGIFKNPKCAEMIRDLAGKKGIIILTDSDSAGKIIRNHIKSIVKDGRVYNAYIPKIAGREKRKNEWSKQGLLGVEGMKEEVIIEAIKKSGAMFGEMQPKFSKSDLFEVGLSGKPGSKTLRKRLMDKLNLPDNLSTGELLSYLNLTTSADELTEMLSKIKQEIF